MSAPTGPPRPAAGASAFSGQSAFSRTGTACRDSAAPVNLYGGVPAPPKYDAVSTLADSGGAIPVGVMPPAFKPSPAAPSSLPTFRIEHPAPAAEPEPVPGSAEPEPAEPVLYIGEVLRTYLIAQRGDEVYFVDKHAAHERILYDQLAQAGDTPVSQPLLLSRTLLLGKREKSALLENAESLERCGFETEDFGGGDVLIRQIPSDVDVEDAKALLQELAGDLLAGKTLDPDSLRDNLLHTIACKSAIKAGWQTSDEELRRLVQEVLSRDDIKYRPHGRPVCVTLTKRQLEKQFKRV